MTAERLNVIEAENERLRAALAICHGTLSDLMAGPFAPASSQGEYALTLCIDTAAEALGK